MSDLLQEHLSSVKRDVEMWLEGEVSNRVEVDLGTGDLDMAVLRFLARNCPDKVQYLEQEFQMRITERSMTFKGMSMNIFNLSYSYEFEFEYFIIYSNFNRFFFSWENLGLFSTSVST